MSESKAPDTNSATRRKPYEPPKLISYGHVKDIVQSGGAGGMSDGTGTSKATGCWVAEALYGAEDPRTLLLRSWLAIVHAERRRGWLFAELYRRIGRPVAWLVRVRLLPRLALLPLFDRLAERAFDEGARTIVHERHRRAV